MGSSGSAADARHHLSVPASAGVVVVAYATTTLDLAWLPSEVPLVVVRNDDQLSDAAVHHPNTRHLRPGTNVGFGAAVNLAAATIDTERIVLVNPDVELTPEHWPALASGEANEVRTVALVDDDGPTSVVSAYPTPLSHLVGGYRVGRFAGRDSTLRRVAAPLLGSSGRTHTDSLRHPVGRWPLATRWVSGAVMALDHARFDAVGRFSSRYFLYYEDLDLCARLAARFPDMEAVVVDAPAGHHAVGGSDNAGDPRTSAAERYRLGSAITYARQKTGFGWRVCAGALEARDRWRNR